MSTAGKTEFKFPHEREDEEFEIEIEPSSAEVIDTSGKKPQKKDEPKVEVEQDDESAEAEIEVVDDTPEKDRGRKPSDPPEEVTEDELEGYSERVRKRIQHFSKGYHDERRAKEAAIRERDELERVTRQLYEQLQHSQGETTKSKSALLEQAKQAANAELQAARREYKEAYEAGETDAVIEAQEKLASAKWKVEQLNRAKPASSLQEEKAPVQTSQQQNRQLAQVDDKAAAWQKENTWFGVEEDMTAFALGLHNKLTKNGVDPRSDEYYEQINARMRKTFPEYFGDMEVEEEPPRKEKQKPSSTSNVVAPATRSTAPKKIRLTQTQVAIAKRLGVPLEEYAKQMAAEMRKADG